MDTDLLRNIAALGGIISVVITIIRFQKDKEKESKEAERILEVRRKESEERLLTLENLHHKIGHLGFEYSMAKDELDKMHNDPEYYAEYYDALERSDIRNNEDSKKRVLLDLMEEYNSKYRRLTKTEKSKYEYCENADEIVAVYGVYL